MQNRRPLSFRVVLALLFLLVSVDTVHADCTLTPNLSLCKRIAPDKYQRADEDALINAVDAFATNLTPLGKIIGPLPAANFPALTGDVTTVAGFLATTLASVATAGTYTKVTVDAKGRTTVGNNALLASADFANQGTTITLLHGNAAGNPSWTAVDLSSLEVTGILAAARFPALTGPITTVAGALATSVAAQTGTGSTFVMNTGPTIAAPLTVAGFAQSTNEPLLYLKQNASTDFGYTFKIDNVTTGNLYLRRTSSGSDIAGRFLAFTDLGYFGVGTTAPVSLFSVGATSQFQVTSAGAIAAAVGITASSTITFSTFSSNGGPLYTNASGVLAQTTAGTTVQVLHGGTAPSFGAVALGTDVSGILPAANGGTGVATLAANGVLYGNGAGIVLVTAQGAANTVLTANAGAPSFSAAPTIGTSVTTPTIYGGTAVGSTLTLAGTSNGLPASAHIILNGAGQGNVSIGGVSPSALLHLKGQNVASRGQLTIEATDFTQISQYNGATQVFTQYHDIANNITHLGTTTAGGQVYFMTDASVTAMTLKAGNVGIGTTAPGAQLDLSTDSARKLTTTAWATGSDIRIKTDVRTIEDGLDIIRQMRPVKYRYNADFLAAHPSVKDVDYYHFIAQEYQKVFPNSVTETDGLLYLNSSNMLPYAIAGIKEIDERTKGIGLSGQGNVIIKGNVGIGTTAPVSLFSVGATSRFQVNTTGDILLNSVLSISATNPTISSGFGTSPSVSGGNGTSSFRINVGTGGTASSGVIGLPTASNGWNCFCEDLTTTSATVDRCKQTASATTTATIENISDIAVLSAWVASDILAVSCFAF